MYVDFAIAQSRGGRDNQEDYCAVWADGKLLTAKESNPQSGRSKSELIAVLCDGMGGHNAGEVASQLASRAFLDAIRPFASRQNQLGVSLPDACEAANNALAAQIDENKSLRGMGTTLIGVRIARSQLTWVSVGDSELYLYRGGTITKLNADHSMRPVIEQMVATNIISPDEALHHPDKNALRSALSGEHVALVDRGGAPVPLRKGDIVVIASDGIATLPDSAIWKLLRSRLFQKTISIARRIVAACDKAGGRHQDNTTVAVLKIR